MPVSQVTSPGPIPKAALDYLRTKKLKPSFDYRDTWREQHAYSFTVAKVMQQDILIDIKQALDDALANGTTFEHFKKELIPELQKKGWWGVRQMADPLTGEVLDVQLGSPRRLRTIYDANLRTARAAGQWDRIQRTKRALPFLVYELGPSIEHRPEHASWAGIILPVDHVFWTTHFAPNGYGCKCRIRQISQAEADRLLATGKYRDKAPKQEFVDWVNKRTGVIEQIPKGIDPGWDSNPGWLRQASLDRDFMKKAKEAGNIEWAVASILSPLRKAEFKTWVNAMFKGTRPGASLRTVAITGNLELDHLASQSFKLEETLTILEGAMLTGKAQKARGTSIPLTNAQWAALPDIIEQAEDILWDKNTGQLFYLTPQKERYIKTVIGLNLKSKRAKRKGLAEKLNSVRTAFSITPAARNTLLGEERYEIIKGGKIKK